MFLKKCKAVLLLIPFGFLACNSDKSLPYLGESEEINGQVVHYTIPSFEFMDQDNNLVSNQTLKGNAYIADFFFTSCPTICPKVKSQMLRLRKEFADRDDFKFLSMSIDYRKDSIPVLRRYAEKLGIDSRNWHLVQLRKDEINERANQFFNVAFEDESAPGGFDHSGRLILVDGDGHIRSYCNGTDPESVDKLAKDIHILFSNAD